MISKRRDFTLPIAKSSLEAKILSSIRSLEGNYPTITDRMIPTEFNYYYYF